MMCWKSALGFGISSYLVDFKCHNNSNISWLNRGLVKIMIWDDKAAEADFTQYRKLEKNSLTELESRLAEMKKRRESENNLTANRN